MCSLSSSLTGASRTVLAIVDAACLCPEDGDPVVAMAVRLTRASDVLRLLVISDGGTEQCGQCGAARCRSLEGAAFYVERIRWDGDKHILADECIRADVVVSKWGVAATWTPSRHFWRAILPVGV